MVILLRLEELNGGRRRDEYLGAFEDALSAREYLIAYQFIKAPIEWSALAPASGPFESVCLYGKKPASVVRAMHTAREAFAILEFS